MVNKLQTISNDKIGRHTEIARSGTMMSESRSDDYGYNTRSELISAAKNGVDEYAYQYDDIGNRESSVEPDNSSTYTANELNQYDAITSQTSQTSHTSQTFIPQYDDDGNQTLVKTKTGIWSVAYNGENRPILWTCGATNIVMKFDRMGRRVEYIEREGETTLKHQRFVYDGYLCVQRLNGANNAVTDLFEWDPTEPVATRPLYWQPRTAEGNFSLFYTHDGNKNVSEVVFYQRARGVAAHYEYAPFGEVTVQTRGNAWGVIGAPSLNPWRFSSEYIDDKIGTIYYVYRHYAYLDARFMTYDAIASSRNLYVRTDNSCEIDYLGLSSITGNETVDIKVNGHWGQVFDHYAPGSSIAHQIAVYKRVWLEDIYRVEMQYTKYCSDERIADIRIDRIEGDMLGSLDYSVFSVVFVGVGVKYSLEKKEIPHYSNNGTHLELDVTFSVVRESVVAATIGIGKVSIDLGLNLEYATEVLGSHTFRLSHDCCD